MDLERKSMFSNILATLIFFSPNFLLLIMEAKTPFFIYNFIILFLLTSTVSNLKFNEVPKSMNNSKNNISKNPTIEAKYKKI